jgi:CheY-like chemotaxis protein
MTNILVLEDEEACATALRFLLENAGYKVDTATNGAEGLELHRSHEYQLVISDLIMPQMDGLETIVELVSQNPAVKVLALSGGLSEMNRSNDVLLPLAKNVGAHRSMSKPYNPEELLETVAEMLAA